MTKNCPVCGKKAEMKFKPFCSERCQKLDLNRWLSEVYRVPGEELSDPPIPANDDEE